jgi:hypothetical protein
MSERTDRLVVTVDELVVHRLDARDAAGLGPALEAALAGQPVGDDPAAIRTAVTQSVRGAVRGLLGGRPR